MLEDEAAQGSSLARFLLRLSQWVLAEQQELAERHVDLARKRQEAAAWADSRPIRLGTRRPKRSCGSFLFPEGARCLDDPDQPLPALRQRRTVRVDQPNPRPIADPISEMLITSNILLTTAIGPFGDR